MSKFTVEERVQYAYASEHELQSLSVWKVKSEVEDLSSTETYPGKLWVMLVRLAIVQCGC